MELTAEIDHLKELFLNYFEYFDTVNRDTSNSIIVKLGCTMLKIKWSLSVTTKLIQDEVNIQSIIGLCELDEYIIRVA